MRQFLKLPPFLKLTNTDPFAAWFVVTGDATPDEIRVVRSVLGAISSLPIVDLPKGRRASRHPPPSSLLLSSLELSDTKVYEP